MSDLRVIGFAHDEASGMQVAIASWDEADAVVAAQAARIAALEAEVKSNRTLALQAVAEVQAARIRVRELEADLDHARRVNGECRVTIGELDRKRDHWRDKAKELEAEVERLRAELKEAKLLAQKMGIAMDVISRGPDTSGMTVTHNVMPAIDVARGE